MPYRYTVHHSNDLLLSATQQRSRSFKRRLLLAALAFGGASLWFGLKPASVPATPSPITTTVATTLDNPAPSTLSPIASAIAMNTINAMPANLNQLQLSSSNIVPLQTTTSAKIPLKNGVSSPRWQTVILKKGDTLGKVFSNNGLSAQQLHAVMSLKEVNSALKRLQPGNEIKLLVNPDKTLQQFQLALNAIDTLEVTRSNNGLKANLTHQPTETQLTYAGATVVHSLSQATRHAGIQGRLGSQLVHIFKDKVDLTRVKPGDRIKVLFEEEYIKGKRIRTGNIVAAEVNVQNQAFRAVRYVDAKGNADYYTPEGLSLKRGFTRHPVNYTYISSGFTHHRFDPILHRMASHEAIDFAAPAGTPIKATGDGRVSFAGNKGGYGNVVTIQHDHKYASLYAHMQRFAANIRPGAHVKQGQVIGYVGQTGMATGPHLHYEFRVNGVKHNPLTVELPSAAPLNRLARAKFIPQARQLMVRLRSDSKIRLVENNHPTTNG